MPGHLRIKNIFLWNFGQEGRSRAHWEKVTDVASHFISLDADKKNDVTSLNIQEMDLSKWQGHVVKIHFGEYKKCVHAKIPGKIKYPFNVTAFRRSLDVPTPVPPTQHTRPTQTPTTPVTGPTQKPTTPVTGPTHGPTPTGRSTTTPHHDGGSTGLRIVFIVSIILIIALVVGVAWFIYKKCLQSSEEKSERSIGKPTTNIYEEKPDPVKPYDVVVVKNSGKNVTGVDNAAHEYETIDEVGRDAGDSPRSDVKNTHELDDISVKVGDVCTDTRGVMDLYDGISETSSEEMEMGKDNYTSLGK